MSPALFELVICKTRSHFMHGSTWTRIVLFVFPGIVRMTGIYHGTQTLVEMGISQTFCLGLPQTMIFPISISLIVFATTPSSLFRSLTNLVGLQQSYLYFPSSWDYRCKPQHLTYTEFSTSIWYKWVILREKNTVLRKYCTGPAQKVSTLYHLWGTIIQVHLDLVMTTLFSLANPYFLFWCTFP
jgi:hypothetical protein